jgi:phospholipid/cholesterol/gamma-HCH transport system substrate-binding protein
MSEHVNQAIEGALGPDDMGEDGAANIRETLSNLNRGTANLAEDTEALKHEFLFRGFFKKHGFYDLAQFSLADYLKACQRQNACGSRTWLDAANLFATGSNGILQLVKVGTTRSTARSPHPWIHCWIMWLSSKLTPIREHLTSHL